MNGGEVNSVFQSKSEILTKAVISGQSPLFSVSFNQIPSYYHNFSEADVATLKGRPKASSDFKVGGPTVAAGQVKEFGSDIGYNSSSCSLGYWPVGPVCPQVLPSSASFSLLPAPETSSGEYNSDNGWMDCVYVMYVCPPLLSLCLCLCLCLSGGCQAPMGGSVGWLVNGVALFGWSDAQSYQDKGVWVGISSRSLLPSLL